MANPIRRLVQLVLDKVAADKLQRDAKQALGGVEKSLESVGSLAKKIGATIAGFFALRSLVNFWKAAVEAAADAQRIFEKLKGTIEATGTAFGPLEGRIRAAGNAFADATIHGDDDFNGALQRMIVLTGDVEASLNNMGLVANVAARFFNGELEPAVELVSKVMNGNTQILKRMGIEVESAQAGLELLAARGFNGAFEEAQTFSGQMAQLKDRIGEFREAIGNVIVESGETGNAIGTLKGAIVALTDSITSQKDLLKKEFVGALEFVVLAVDATYRAVRGLWDILAGGFGVTLGVLPALLAVVAEAFALVAEGAGFVTKALGMDGASAALDSFGKRLDDFARNKFKGFKEGLEQVGRGFGRFTDITQTAADVIAGIQNPNKPKGKSPAFLNAKPQLAKGAKGSGGAGAPDFGTIDATMAAGDFAAGAQFQVAALRGLSDEFAQNENAISDYEEGLRRLAIQTTLGTNAFDAQGNRLDAIAMHFQSLQSEADLLANALEEITPDDPRWNELAGQLGDVQAEMIAVQKEAKLMADAAGLAGEIVGAALSGGLVPFAKAKARSNLIQAAEETAHGIAASLSIFGAADAAKHFALAAKFAGIAAAWGALAKGAGAAGIGGGGGSGGSSRAGANAANRAEQPQPEIKIFLTGPGFSALNPQVQKVVYGAMQQARERYGENANVRLQLGSS